MLYLYMHGAICICNYNWSVPVFCIFFISKVLLWIPAISIRTVDAIPVTGHFIPNIFISNFSFRDITCCQIKFLSKTPAGQNPCRAYVLRKKHNRAEGGRLMCRISCVTRPNWLMVIFDSWTFLGLGQGSDWG